GPGGRSRALVLSPGSFPPPSLVFEAACCVAPPVTWGRPCSVVAPCHRLRILTEAGRKLPGESTSQPAGRCRSCAAARRRRSCAFVVERIYPRDGNGAGK